MEQQEASVKYVELRIKEIVESEDEANNDGKVTFKLKLSNGIRYELRILCVHK